MASTDLVFTNEAEAHEAIADLRNNNTPTNFVLFTYSDTQKNTLNFTAKGNGGVEELKTRLDPAKASYGLVRVIDKIDDSVTVKFVFIVWVGEKVPFIKKAQITTHKGSITALVGQYHNDVQASDLSELNEEIVLSKVSAASGSASHVRDSGGPHHPASGNTPSPTSSSPTPVTTSYRATQSTTPKSVNTTKTPGVGAAATTSVIQFVNEDDIRAAIKHLRANHDPTDWVLLGYEGNSNKVHLVSKGVSGLDELVHHLKEDQIFYGLYRTTDTIDNTVAVKFVFIIWVGEQVPIIRKARIATHKGEITSFVGQYHVDLNCSNLSEINEDIVHNLVQRASGTAVHVK